MKIINHFINSNFINEEKEQTLSNIKDNLIKRIPFLKDYNVFKNPRDPKRLEAQRVVYNQNVNVIMGDQILNFPQFNISSNIFYFVNSGN